MITDSILRLGQYRGLYKNLDTAIDFLAGCNLNELPDGTTQIDGSRVFVNVMEAELREAEGAVYEYHKRYADLQINITGSEYWELTMEGRPAAEFDEAADIGFVSGQAHSMGILGNGRFALFLPYEFHKPSCISSVSSHVRKAVVKIEIS